MRIKLIFHLPEKKAKKKVADRSNDPTVTLTCLSCGKEFKRRRAYYTSATSKGIDRFFCGKTCFGLSRRDNKSAEQKKAEKAEYDRQYRAKNAETLKVKKHALFKRTYDPASAAIYRQKIMPRHLEYCRRPEYRAKKKVYDQVHRAKVNYGEFWESALLVKEIEAQYDQREVRQINNLDNKTQKRKRDHGNNRH